MIVMKFGGTSVGSAKAIRAICNIISSRVSFQPLVVTSAMGGVTNKLVALSRIAGEGKADESWDLVQDILSKHKLVSHELGIDGDETFTHDFDNGVDALKNAVQAILSHGALTDELYDGLVGWGEYFTANMIPAVLRSMGLSSEMVDSRTLLLTDSTFSAARPLFEDSKHLVQEHLRPIIDDGNIPVLQGFVGSNKEGKTTTLGRGGSDFSATLFGAMLDAEKVEIWSDVDGVLTADPSLVKEAYRIRHMSFREAAELAYFGAKVLHPSTLLPAVDHDISVVVLNSMNPEFHGTAISKESPVEAWREGIVKSIAYKEGLTVITVSSTRMLMAHGFMALLFSIFEKYQTAVDLVSTSEVTVSLTIDDTKHLGDIIPELEKFATVKVEVGKAVVCLVGEGLTRNIGIPGQVFGLLQDTHIYSISQGASEINLSFVIDDDALPQVTTRLHHYFFDRDLDPEIFSIE